MKKELTPKQEDFILNDGVMTTPKTNNQDNKSEDNLLINDNQSIRQDEEIIKKLREIVRSDLYRDLSKEEIIIVKLALTLQKKNELLLELGIKETSEGIE